MSHFSSATRRTFRPAFTRFKVYHGNDLKPFMKTSRRDIETEFGIVGQATWEFDDHERCQQLDKEEFRRMLGIKEDWDAV